MCRAMTENGYFDPDLCPLLQGLTPDEIHREMIENPDIRACMASLHDHVAPVRGLSRACGQFDRDMSVKLIH